MGRIQEDSRAILRAINKSRGTVLCARLEQAGGVTGKSRGLLGRERLEPGTGMLFEAGWLEPFMCMHMMFMRFPIDIVFLDRENVVIRVNHHLKPWRFSSIVWRARRAMEIEAGAVSASSTQIGDEIAFDVS